MTTISSCLNNKTTARVEARFGDRIIYPGVTPFEVLMEQIEITNAEVQRSLVVHGADQYNGAWVG